MHVIDWLIVGVYLLAAVGIGVWFTRRASRGTGDFFVAGRSLPWWIAGTSIVATTFSTDTPLQVARLTREGGAGYNWWWWGIVFGYMATVFFFARLWRRTGAETDVAFIEQRYAPGRERELLRGFQAVFGGVLVNCWVLASVTLAASKLIQVMLGLDAAVTVVTVPGMGDISEPLAATLTLAALALAYSLLSGMYGVVYTDLIQFGLAMAGSIWLAVGAFCRVQDEGGFDAIRTPEGDPALVTNLFPDFGDGGTMLVFTFAVWAGVAWWDNAPGRFYAVQRVLSCRDEKQASLAYLWSAVATFALRSWPWIVVGAASLVVFPVLDDDEAAYPLMINELLGPGFKGVMVAAMLAAYMSTVDTQLNWGASYLVNDLYRPYLRRRASDRHYVAVARAAMVLLTVITLLIVPRLTGIKEAYQYLAVITGGIGTVMVLRWYWWRVNAWSEISAILAAVVVANTVNAWLKADDGASTYTKDYYWALRQVVTILTVAVVWVTVTWWTSRAAPAHTFEVFGGGCGWRVRAGGGSRRPSRCKPSADRWPPR